MTQHCALQKLAYLREERENHAPDWPALTLGIFLAKTLVEKNLGGPGPPGPSFRYGPVPRY
jgi:hypothetical protein